ncbi:hypothetical protein MC885_014433, partial [Smutsia gigantea]
AEALSAADLLTCAVIWAHGFLVYAGNQAVNQNLNLWSQELMGHP